MKKKLTRDNNIILNFKREINLNTRVVKSKKAYSRKIKHKAQGFWFSSILTHQRHYYAYFLILQVFSYSLYP